VRCYICDTTKGNIFIDPHDESREICQKCWDESSASPDLEDVEFIIERDALEDSEDFSLLLSNTPAV